MSGFELGEAGTLRVAVAVSSAGGAFWSHPGEAGGEPRGVAVDLGRALAGHLRLKPRFVVFPNSNAITEAADRDGWDATFIPFDSERAERMDFGPVYNRSESTLLLRAGLDGETVADLDRPDVTILAVTRTTTGRALIAWAKQARVVEVDTIDEIARRLAAGEADAFAMSRDSLERMARDLPGARVAAGQFFAASTAFATPPRRPKLLEAGSQWLLRAMRDGTLRRVLDANDMADADVPAI